MATATLKDEPPKVEKAELKPDLNPEASPLPNPDLIGAFNVFFALFNGFFCFSLWV
jgi:hypothetical protein